ncbi:MAG TPA: phage holin family protein [Acidimicrobiales bacterium]
MPEVAAELWALTKDYALQETVEPVKELGRYLGYGVLGAVLGGFGVVMLLLAALRALQTETGDTFDGTWSWVPYLIVILIAAVLIAVAVSRIGRARRKQQEHQGNR